LYDSIAQEVGPPGCRHQQFMLTQKDIALLQTALHDSNMRQTGSHLLL